MADIEITPPAPIEIEVSVPGPQGIQGPAGTNGTDGADGVGVPVGGTVGQVLAKASGADYDTAWVDPTGGGGASDPATDTTAGVVKTDVTEADPVVYTRATTDTLLAAKAAAADLTAETAARTAADSALDTRLDAVETDLAGKTDEADFAAHTLDTTAVHGITNTANLVYTSDARLSDARTPTAHASTHATAGSDPIAPGDIGAAEASHTHAIADTTGLQAALDGKADDANVTALDARVDALEAAPPAHTHDDRYYTEGETDTLLAAKAAAADVTALDDRVDALEAVTPAPVATQAASYVLTLADAGRWIGLDVAGAHDLTVPPNADVAFPVGTEVHLVQMGAGQTTVVAGTGVTIRTPETLKLAKQYAAATLKQVAADEWVLAGYLEAAP